MYYRKGDNERKEVNNCYYESEHGVLVTRRSDYTSAIKCHNLGAPMSEQGITAVGCWVDLAMRQVWQSLKEPTQEMESLGQRQSYWFPDKLDSVAHKRWKKRRRKSRWSLSLHQFLLFFAFEVTSTRQFWQYILSIAPSQVDRNDAEVDDVTHR